MSIRFQTQVSGKKVRISYAKGDSGVYLEFGISSAVNKDMLSISLPRNRKIKIFIFIFLFCILKCDISQFTEGIDFGVPGRHLKYIFLFTFILAWSSF